MSYSASPFQAIIYVNIYFVNSLQPPLPTQPRDLPMTHLLSKVSRPSFFLLSGPTFYSYIGIAVEDWEEGELFTIMIIIRHI